MKKLWILLFCLIPFICHATMMTDFTEDTTPSSTDIVWTTKNPGTTPLDRKVSLANLFGIGLGLNNTWTGSNTFKSTVAIQQADATPIITFPAAAPTSGKSGLAQVTDGGVMSWLEPTANCFSGGNSGATAFECRDVPTAWSLIVTEAVTGTATGGQLVCFNTDGTTKFESCGAPITDNSTASHAVYKDSSGYIADQTLVIDAHAASTTITLIPGICPIIHNASQADSNINNTLPAVGAGKCFVALATSAETDKYWRLTAAAANTICLNRTCGKDYIQFDTPAVGDTFTCISDGTNWYCYDRDSDATAGDL